MCWPPLLVTHTPTLTTLMAGNPPEPGTADGEIRVALENAYPGLRITAGDVGTYGAKKSVQGCSSLPSSSVSAGSAVVVTAAVLVGPVIAVVL